MFRLLCTQRTQVTFTNIDFIREPGSGAAAVLRAGTPDPDLGAYIFLNVRAPYNIL